MIVVSEGILIIGLMGVLIEAKHRSLLSSVRQCVGELEVQADFRVSPALKQKIFSQAGE